MHNIYRPHPKDGGRFCIHRRLSVKQGARGTPSASHNTSTGPVSLPGRGGRGVGEPGHVRMGYRGRARSEQGVMSGWGTPLTRSGCPPPPARSGQDGSPPLPPAPQSGTAMGYPWLGQVRMG